MFGNCPAMYFSFLVLFFLLVHFIVLKYPFYDRKLKTSQRTQSERSAAVDFDVFCKTSQRTVLWVRQRRNVRNAEDGDVFGKQNTNCRRYREKRIRTFWISKYSHFPFPFPFSFFISFLFSLSSSYYLSINEQRN